MKKSTKKLLSVLLVVAMMASLLVVPAAAAADVAPGVYQLSAKGHAGEQGSHIDAADKLPAGIEFDDSFKFDNDHGPHSGGGVMTVNIPAGKYSTLMVTVCQYGMGGAVTASSGAVGTGKDASGSNDAGLEYTIANATGATAITFGAEVYVHGLTVGEFTDEPVILPPTVTAADEVTDVLVGETTTIDVGLENAEGKAVTWDYSVAADAAITDVDSTEDGKVSFTGAKAGKATLTLTAIVDGTEYPKDVTVYVRPAQLGDVQEGTYEFAGADGKTTYLTTGEVAFSAGWKYHGAEHGLTNSGADTFDVKIPDGKKAIVTLITCCYGGAGITSTTGDLIQGTAPEGEQSANTWTLLGVTGTANFTAPASSSVYIHGIQVELVDLGADMMAVSPGTVSMRAGESKDVTVVLDGFAGKSVFAVSANEKVATAQVTDKTITIEGKAAGDTKVYVVMADAQPTLAEAVADKSAKAVTVNVQAALAAGAREWIWGGKDGSHDATTFEKDSEGLQFAEGNKVVAEDGTVTYASVTYHNHYGLLAKPKMAEDGTTIEVPATIGIPVEGPSKITVEVGYTWDIMLGDAQSPSRYGTSDSGDGTSEYQFPVVFDYYGGAGYVTLTATEKTSSYIYSIKVEPDATIPAVPKVAVWDLAGTQLDETMFDNKLTVEDIIAFYPPSEQWPDPKVPTLTDFATADGEFEFVAEANDNEALSHNGRRADYRLRSGLEALAGWVHSTNNHTKNDVALGADPYDPTLTQYNVSFQSNGGAMTFKIKADAGDKLTFTYANSGTADGAIFMDYIDAADAESGTVTKVLENQKGVSNGNIASVYVAQGGIQTLTHGLDPDGNVQKPAVSRFYRETPTTATITGNLTVGADVDAGYKLVATDDVSGVEYPATVADGKYSIEVNNYLSGTSFTLSVQDAEGCIVGAGAEVSVAAGASSVENDVAIIKVELVTVSGTVTGLDAALADLAIGVAIPEGKIYVPKIIPAEDGTYTAKLEKGVAYTLTAKNVNDYTLGVTTLNKSADETGVDLPFTPKPLYAVTLTADPADVDMSGMKFTFTNFSETDDKHPDGYVYTFEGVADIKLRDGQYKVKLDGAPYPTKLVSDLKVNGAAAAKTITFVKETPTSWVFLQDAFTAEVLAAKDFNMLKLDGDVRREAKDHAILGNGGKLSVPVDGPCKVNVTVYYAAEGTIGVGEDTVALATDLSTGTTGSTDTITYEYTGEGAGYVDVIATATSYITRIDVVKAVPYVPTLTVGVDKDFQTIQAAVDAASKMERADGQRVTIVIDPGNYEEMVWVKTPNITFKNAASDPSIALKNQGKDIEDTAVRITWYYGCGFDYYSMGPNSKFSAEQFAVNLENGYVSHPNSAGGGSNNECWWNATTVIAAKGFQAENIIFENSFNQYVSAAAAADVIVPNGGAKEDASKPRASLPEGSTEVQRKAYVERAAAIALANDVASEAFFDHCAFVGHQDVIYGGRDVKAGFYDCDVFGACDYIFGPMTAVFAKCDMVLNVGADNDSNDVAYITAPQNGSNAHGYLMYNCTVRNVEPGVENAGAAKSALQHEFGRAWGGATAECIFFETLVGTNANGQSMISPAGWNTGLGSSQICAEYHTHEEAAAYDHSQRIFGGVLATPETVAGASLTDWAGWLGGWDPFAGKFMTIEGCPENPFTPPDKTALVSAIAAAKAAMDGVYAVEADTAASDVTSGTKFVTESVMAALKEAVAKAEAMVPNDRVSEEQVADAVKALNAAVETFKAAIQTGTKGSGGGLAPSGGGSSSRPATGTTTTYKNANGDTVKKTTDRNGNVTITVTAADGELLANVELPASIPALSKKFKDVPDEHWAATSINDLAALGLVKGVADEIYDMNTPVTRGSLATILFRLARAKGAVSSFSDVAADAWYADAVGWAAKAGVIAGKGDGTFSADESITREQLAVMLYRFANLLGLDTKAIGKLDSFVDGASTSDWATEAMTWAVGAGILKGNNVNELNPVDAATRAETACMVDRFLGLVK